MDALTILELALSIVDSLGTAFAAHIDQLTTTAAQFSNCVDAIVNDVNISA